jgi:hypothetical protein
MEESTSTQGKQSEAAPAQEQRRSGRLNFGDPKLRPAHVQAFFAWLPSILHDAPGICWESLPSIVMGYLIRRVADSPDAVAIVLAIGSAIDGCKQQTLYRLCSHLTNLLSTLRRTHGMTALAELSNRTIWDRFVEGRMISSGDLLKLAIYDACSSTDRQAFEESLTERQKVFWRPHLLPPLPHGFLSKKAQRKAVEATSQDRRKQQSDVILPLFPLLVELVQLRKQAAERLIKEFRLHRDRALAGEIALPYRFQFVDRSFSVSESATTLAEVQLLERDVTLSLTLWDRHSWVKEHWEQYSKRRRLEWKRQEGPYAPERNMCFLQYEGSPDDLLWIGDLIEHQLLGQAKSEGISVARPGLLSPTISEAKWLWWARRHSEAVLFVQSRLVCSYVGNPFLDQREPCE